ncbi:hypothetical protein [Corynebacterium riegelii]|uniref:hypothetical protein n=1 Tax=Corynebacterium riegelii TaxID=156976 RepID=UPI00191E0926|nr:hypothetical protein [Corynebacterium riegelii]QQU84593.1 hypothetical protein I6I71_03290 [Corynebacterium riegelii]
MGDWKKELRGQLIDIRVHRTLPRETHEALQRGRLQTLSTSHAIDAVAYLSLPVNQQHWLRAYCVGLSMRNAVITGRASAYLNDMWVANTPLHEVQVVLKSVPPRPSWPAGVRYIQTTTRDIVRGDHMSTTSPFQTFLHIARFDGFPHALTTADWLVQYGGFSVASLQREVAMSPRVPGIGVAACAAAHASTRSESAPEAFMRGLLIHAGYTDLEVNPVVTDKRYRVDLLHRHRLAVEMDGLVKMDGATYGPTDQAFRKEKFRQDYITNHGIDFLRVAPWLVEREPERFLAMFNAAVTRIFGPDAVP